MCDKKTKNELSIEEAVASVRQFHAHIDMAGDLIYSAKTLVNGEGCPDKAYLVLQPIIASAEMHLHQGNEHLIKACGLRKAKEKEAKEYARIPLSWDKETPPVIKLEGDCLYILDDDGEKVYAYSIKNQTRVTV